MIWFLLSVVVLIYLVANITETVAHKSPKTTDDLEDLRLAYAPDLSQVFLAEKLYKIRKTQERYAQEIRMVKETEQQRVDYNKSEQDRYRRELEEVRIKRWLEGNPITDEHPLTKKEQPRKPQYIHLYPS